MTRRGELVVAAPVGFVKVGDRLEKDPDRRVQAAILLAIDKVAELGSVKRARPLLAWKSLTAVRRLPSPGGAAVDRSARFLSWWLP